MLLLILSLSLIRITHYQLNAKRKCCLGFSQVFLYIYIYIRIKQTFNVPGKCAPTLPDFARAVPVGLLSVFTFRVVMSVNSIRISLHI
jgi:hypothetical protein